MGFLDKLKGMFGGNSSQGQDLNAGMPGQTPDSTNQVSPTPTASPDAGQQQPGMGAAGGPAPQDTDPVAPGAAPQDNDPNRPTQ